MKQISDTVTCENCNTEVEVMFYPSDDGNPDIESSTCCPPSPAYHDPEECPECSYVLPCEQDADMMIQESREMADDLKFDEMRERRMGL